MEGLKEKIEKAESIAIVIPEYASRETALAALSLKKAADKKGFIVGGARALKEWEDLFGEELFNLKDFAITIDTKKYPIEELKYETDEDALTIRLTTSALLTEKNILFSTLLPRSDLVLTLGFTDEEEKSAALLNLPKNIAERECIAITDTLAAKMSRPLLNLLARVILRSREEKDINTIWSFITREDFIKTESAPQNMPAIVEMLAYLANLPLFTAILWQTGGTNEVGGLVFARDQNRLSRLAEALGKDLSSNYFILPNFPNFTEAEITLRKLLKSVL